MPSGSAPPPTPPAKDTTPATGLASTPGDYGFSVGAPIGRYVVLERLGGGGMGVVYSAYDPKLDRRVALKLLRPDVSGSGDAQKRLLREGQTLARLAHPNVVNVHDLGEFEGRVFVDMEFVKGTTLTQWLDLRPRSWREVVDVFVQAGRGLAAAHAVGIVHRDFKPDNVLVGDDGRVRVADFGIAFLARSDSAPPSSSPARESAPHGKTDDPVVTSAIGGTTGNIVQGTPLYMAPEQLQGRAADARSDQWSFCVALAEALSGEHPFAGLPLAALRSGEGVGTSLAKSAPVRGMPAWPRAILLRGLSTEPDARFPSMDALLAALTHDPRAGWVRLAGAAALVVAVGAAAFGYVRLRHERSLVCTNGEERLAGVWDDGRRQAASRAFAATGKPFAGAAWDGARTVLDDYAREWARTYQDSCEATHVRGEQSAELLDLRMACLSDRRKELGALADVFTHADVPVVTNALAASQSLPPLASCSDAKSLRARVKPPEAALLARVESIRGDLAGVRAMASAGRDRDIATRAHELADAADATGYVPLQAEALLVDGNVREHTGDYAGAEAALFRAARAADAAGDDRLRVEIVTKLLNVVGLREAKRELVPLLRDQTEAAIARIGSYDEGEARLDQAMGGILLGEGKAEEALESSKRALAEWEKLRGKDSREAARVLGNMGVVYEALGNADLALDSYQRSLAIETKVLGPDHPELVTEWHNIGNIHQAKLEFKESAEGYEHGLKIAEASLGPDHPLVGECLDGLGDAIAELGEYDRAVKLHERALSIKEKVLSPDNPQLVYTLIGLGEALLKQAHPDPARAVPLLERGLALPSTGYDDDVAAVQFALARALVMAGRDPARAHGLAVQARDTYRKNATLPAEKQNLADVDAWLAGKR